MEIGHKYSLILDTISQIDWDTHLLLLHVLGVRAACVRTLHRMYVAIYGSCALYYFYMHLDGLYTHCIRTARRKRAARPSASPYAHWMYAVVRMGCAWAVYALYIYNKPARRAFSSDIATAKTF